MLVKDLIELLGECDPDAQVFLMIQQKWPFECRLAGLAVREDFERDHEDDEDERERPEGTAASDVFILEGEQRRYGDRRAWSETR